MDTHSAFEDPILSLSLGSSVVMEFRNQDGLVIPVLLPQRSLLVMSGEARLVTLIIKFAYNILVLFYHSVNFYTNFFCL